MDAGEILSVVFGSLLPERWKSSDDAASFMDELTSMGIDKLAREPERLQEEKAHILSETRDLAFHNYKTFIETAECSKEVFQDFQSVEGHLDGLLDRLPAFGDACKGLGDVAKDINARRRINSLTLSRHTQLLEILEIPQLMDTCVRNNYYEEALELSAYVRQLKQKFSSISIVADIVAEVDACSQLMLQQLLQQLRGQIQLPACLKIIGYLRRLEVFSEIELRLKFLQARDCWFQGQVNALPAENAYQHISKVIEVCRVYIFDVITQYRAIFADDSEPLMRGAAAASAVAGAGTQQSVSGIFHSWLVTKVSWFLAVLRADLRAGVSNRLDSLMGQCMYFGLSLGRIGTDFRALLPPLFQEAALELFRRNVDAAMSAFRSALSHYMLASSVLLHAHSSLLSSTLAASSAGAAAGSLAPNQLLEFPPLASLSNGLMGAFNDLRPCAPLAVAPDVVTCLEQCLRDAAACLHAYHQTESSAITSSEADVFARLCAIFVHTLVPLVQATLERLFPVDALVHATGSEAATAGLQDSDVVRALTLDVATISAPIRGHLAVAEAAVVAAAPDADEALARGLEQAKLHLPPPEPTVNISGGGGDTSVIAVDPVSDAVTSDAVTSDPVTSNPVTSDAVTSDPVTSDAVTSDPVTSDPVTSDPVTSEGPVSTASTDEPPN